MKLIKNMAIIISSILLSSCAVQEVKEKKEVTLKESDWKFPAPPEETRYVFEMAFTSSADIIKDPKLKEKAKSRSFLDAFIGTTQELNYSLSKPYALTVNKGKLYVSDTGDQNVKLFDLKTGKFSVVNEKEEVLITQPLGIDVDRGSGNLYVVDGVQKKIVIFDTDNKVVGYIQGKDKDGEPVFVKPISIAINPKNNRIYVLDMGLISTDKHRVRVFDLLTRKHLFDFGGRGGSPGNLNLPRDISINSKGEILVVDGGNFRVQIFDADGKFLRSFGKNGRNYGDFARPKEMGVDSEDNMYIIDTAFGNFQIFNKEGELLMFIGQRSEKNGIAKYMLPSGIAVDVDNRIYVVDQLFKRIDVYRPVGVKKEEGYGFFSEDK